MSASLNISTDIYSQPPFNTFSYSIVAQIYYIAIGLLTIFGNFYLIVLFLLYEKLRQLQCNWLIAYLSVVEILIGIGTFNRGILIIIAEAYNIVRFNFIFCSISVNIVFAVSYRLEQSIALMIALDRLIAIWKPVWYNKIQNNRICLVVLILSVIVYAILSFFVLFDVSEKNTVGLADISTVTLNNCVIIIAYYWYQVLPSYSGIISIVFFVVYLTSLCLFWRNVRKTKKNQIHAKDAISKMQSRVFVTVSLALVSMLIFYVVPTILQMLGYYFQITGWVINVSLGIIQYGAEFNGILNAIIYLMKHQEFRQSSKRFLSKFTGKTTTGNNNAWGSTNVS